MDKALTFSVNEQGVAKVMFDLPGEKVNKFNLDVIAEWEKLVQELKKDVVIQALVVESSKKNIFIAGADLSLLSQIRDPEDALQKAKRGQALFQSWSELPFPTVAVIDGACLGGGLELALACTYRLVTDNDKTQLGLPEVTLGILPGWGGTQRLPRLIGLSRALPLILSGKSLSGSQALKSGIADAMVAKEFLEEGKKRFLQDILSEGGKKRILEKRKPVWWTHWLLDKNPFGHALVFHLAKKDVLKQTKGHYPAPLKALEVVQKSHCGGLEDGLKIEADGFSNLLPTPVCRNLMQLFFIQEDLKKETGVSEKMTPKILRSTGVLGAGVMGGGISWLFSNKDFKVRLKDVTWDAIAKGYQAASVSYQELTKRRKLTSFQANVKMHKISATTDFSGFSKLDLIVEAVVENLEIKKKIFSELETKIGETTIVASNTSSLSIGDMAKAFQNPGRFIGMHFFNPVPRMPLVEVIPGEHTSFGTIATVVALAKSLGKTPVLVKDVPGFLINRILLPYMNEAVLLFEEGVDIQKIDHAIHEFGMPMGPITLADEVGLDVCHKVTQILSKAYPRVASSALLKEMVETQKLLGKKLGKGFYTYSGKNKLVNSTVITLRNNLKKSQNSEHTHSDPEIVDRLMLLLVNESARSLQEGVVNKAATLDLSMLMGTGFPPFRGGPLRYADARSLSGVVDALQNLEKKVGERFAPCELLLEMSKSGRKFYDV